MDYILSGMELYTGGQNFSAVKIKNDRRNSGGTLRRKEKREEREKHREIEKKRENMRGKD